MDAALPPAAATSNGPAAAILDTVAAPPTVAVTSIVADPCTAVVAALAGSVNPTAAAPNRVVVPSLPPDVAAIAQLPGRGGGRGGNRGSSRDGGGCGGGGHGGNAGTGRKSGVRNYKNEILIRIIDKERPIGNNMWERVANRYQEESGDADIHEVKDLKDHWIRKLCNNFKKPTGKTGENGDRINQCIEIERAMQLQQEAAVLGASSGEGEEEDDNTSGLEDTFGGSFDRNDDDEDEAAEVDVIVAVAPAAANNRSPVPTQVPTQGGVANARVSILAVQAHRMMEA